MVKNLAISISMLFVLFSLEGSAQDTAGQCRTNVLGALAARVGNTSRTLGVYVAQHRERKALITAINKTLLPENAKKELVGLVRRNGSLQGVLETEILLATLAEVELPVGKTSALMKLIFEVQETDTQLPREYRVTYEERFSGFLTDFPEFAEAYASLGGTIEPGIRYN